MCAVHVIYMFWHPVNTVCSSEGGPEALELPRWTFLGWNPSSAPCKLRDVPLFKLLHFRKLRIHLCKMIIVLKMYTYFENPLYSQGR